MSDKLEKFNPNDHLTSIKGKDYLEVKWRLVWFRQERPDWGIETDIVDRGDKWVIMRAIIKNSDNQVVAIGHKAETKANFGDYLEKAETGAIGRALAHCGYGTQFAPELDEGERIVDAPIGKEKVEQIIQKNDNSRQVVQKEARTFETEGDRIARDGAETKKQLDKVAESKSGQPMTEAQKTLLVKRATPEYTASQVVSATNGLTFEQAHEYINDIKAFRAYLEQKING